MGLGRETLVITRAQALSLFNRHADGWWLERTPCPVTKRSMEIYSACTFLFVPCFVLGFPVIEQRQGGNLSQVLRSITHSHRHLVRAVLSPVSSADQSTRKVNNQCLLMRQNKPM